MHLPAMQTVNADRKRPKATEVTEDAKIAENDGAREDPRPPSWGTPALRAAMAEAQTHTPRKGDLIEKCSRMFAYVRLCSLMFA